MLTRKNFLAGSAALIASSILAACGNSGSASSSASETKTLTVAASPSPHAEILNNFAVPKLKDQNIDLEVKEYTDYIIPNQVTSSGEVDANYFQHINYLNWFNGEYNTHLVSAAYVHYEPFGIYAGKVSAIADLKDGDEIDIPNDGSNETRALLLLQQEGLITLKDGITAASNATIQDIESYNVNITIREIEAAQLTQALPGIAMAVINGNYALQGGLNAGSDALAIEAADGDAAQEYGNILAVKEGTEESDKVKALVAALESKQVADFITETYNGSVVSTVENPTDGYDATVDYDALKGQKITVAASTTTHAEILKVAQEILAAKDVELEIVEFTDYVQPNLVVDNGEIDANYFQHLPYLEDFNAENGTKLVSVSVIHVEPMGLYGGRQTTLDALGLSK